MANYCDYEIHVRGKKMDALMMYAILPAYDGKTIINEKGSDSDYIVWIKGNCKWSLNHRTEEDPNASINANDYSEDEIRNADCGIPFWSLPIEQKAKLLDVEMLISSTFEGEDYGLFEHYKSGELVNSEEFEVEEEIPEWDEVEDEYDSYREYCEEYDLNPNVRPPKWWDREEFETYEEFCEEFGINPTILPESEWVEDDEEEGIYYFKRDLSSEEADINTNFEF